MAATSDLSAMAKEKRKPIKEGETATPGGRVFATPAEY